MKCDDRVKFYSVHDLGARIQLSKIPKVLDDNISQLDYSDVNQIIEVYNIKKYIDLGLALINWTESQIENYKALCRKEIPKYISTFFNQLTDENIKTTHDSLTMMYHDDFWELYEKYNLQNTITSIAFSKILHTENVQLLRILEHKKIVRAYGASIADYLRNHPKRAELIMQKHLQRRDSQKEIYFPDELNPNDKVKIIAEYIDLPDANPNYVELVVNSSSSPELPIDDRLRLKAKQIYKKWVEDHIDFDSGISFSASVCFTDSDNPVDYSIHNMTIDFVYGTEWIENNMDCPTLLNNLLYLFWLVDGRYRCVLVSSPSQMSIIERFMGIKSKFEYDTGFQFRLMELISSAQITGYKQFLNSKGVYLEFLFKWFFECYLRIEFNTTGFVYEAPSKSSTTIEKCRTLAISMDSVLKQFRMYCNDGIIDRELFEMSSDHLFFDRIPSLQPKKYIYAKSDDIRTEMHLCYSDQSLLTYNRKSKGEYNNLPHMLLQGKFEIDDFEPYQKPEIDFLKERGLIENSDSRYLVLNSYRSTILKELFYYEVICYSYCNPETKSLIDQLVESGDLEVGNTLFSKPEQDYMNYMLNKAAYSNGMNIRNRYIHGTHSLDPKIIEHEYTELLKLTAIMVIKINEEFCLWSQQSK